jgi:predicted porin
MTKTTINAASVVYSKDALKVDAVWAGNKSEALVGSVQASKTTSWKIGAQYKFGKFTPFAKYGQGKQEMGTGGALDRDLTGYQVGSEYMMSKRTSLYAVYGYQSAKVSATTGSTYQSGDKYKATEMALGLRHSF